MSRHMTAGLESVEDLELDGCCVLKNAMPPADLKDPRNQQVRVYQFWVPSDPDKRERFIERVRRPLNKRYGDIGDHASMVLNEALMNAEEHAHHNDASHWSYVQFFLFPHRIVYTAQYVPTRFDPSTVRTSAWGKNGTFHNKPRGRGHIFMTNLSDALEYPLAKGNGQPPFTWEIHAANAVPDPR